MAEPETILTTVSAAFWNDEFWLPPNVSWKDIEVDPDAAADDPNVIQYARFEDLGYPILAAWCVLVLRQFVEKRLFRAIGKYFGLQDRKRTPPPANAILEEAFKKSLPSKKICQLEDSEMTALSKRTDLSVREIERWLRQRSLIGKASKLDKFCESAWKAFYYTTMYVFSWVILWDKPWFWEINYCWNRYPEHSLTTDVWLYYMIELSFYWSLLISQFFDVQRSDFWEMFAHHVATILLLGLSWTCNLWRVGTLVLWVHDCADVFLESAKMFKYAGKEGVADILFYCFAISWMVTRLGYFPTWILYSINVEAGQFIQYFHAYHVFSGLLSILLILNLFWAYFIFKVAYLAFMEPEGKIERDLRSETNSSD